MVFLSPPFTPLVVLPQKANRRERDAALARVGMAVGELRSGTMALARTLSQMEQGLPALSSEARVHLALT